MPFSKKLTTPLYSLQQSDLVFVYFNSWGSSYTQSLYLSEPLKRVTTCFYQITVQLTNVGGFDGNLIPTNESVQSTKFKESVILQTQQLLTCVVNSLNTILAENPCKKIVLMSHSFGYTLLYAGLEKSLWSDKISRIQQIILLDPAGKANSLISLTQDIEIYGRFIQEFQKFYQSPFTITRNNNVFSEWKAFIHKSTQTLYTEAEKTTGMYRYITDCFNNSPLTLSVFAYGVDFWCLDPIIRKYSDISIILTSTNGLALGNQNYWKSVGISDIQVISNAGHFLQIFSQKQTIEAILRILDIRPYDFIEFGVSYNFPIMSLPPTSIDLNCVANQ